MKHALAVALVLLAGCASKHAPRTTPGAQPFAPGAVPEVSFVGVVRELDRGCWADAHDCRVRVDDRWLTITGHDPSTPRGRIVGFGSAGAPNELLDDRNLGASVKVFALATSQPTVDARGMLVTPPPDPNRLTLMGSETYFIERVR